MPANLEKSPFILGTAQLGLTYGIANKDGKPTFDTALEIIKMATEGGVVGFDTATAYGDSQEILGKALRKLGLQNAAYVITKISAHDAANSQLIFNELGDSVQSLEIPRFWAVLGHSASDVIAFPELYEELFSKLKNNGLSDLTGVSVYTSEEALSCLSMSQVDLVQMPLNVFDQRAVSEKIIEQAKKLNKLLVFRSIYLQGLLLLNPEDLSDNLRFARPFLREWRLLCSKFNIQPKQAAFIVAKELRGPFPFIVGLETLDQLKENLELADLNFKNTEPFIYESQVLCARADERLINPSLW